MISQIKSLQVWRILAVTSLIWLFISHPYDLKQKGFKVIEWDVTIYYSYLPALFIHNDIKLQEDWVNNLNEHQFGWLSTPEGKRYFKMTSGLAILYSPFFLIAHGITSLVSPEMATGYSVPYRFAILFGSVLYVLFGLWCLRKVLLRFYSDKVVSWTILMIYLGTNLLHYTVWRGAMSHGHSFMLSAFLMFNLFKYIDRQNWKYIIWMGFAAGLITLIRPVNVLIPIMLFSYMFIKLSKKGVVLNWKHGLALPILGFSVLFIQMSYWKYVTGNWIVYSYAEEGFFWNDSKIIEGLFSYRKGWLLYSPLLALSLIGFYFLRNVDRTLSMLSSVMFLVVLYVTFAWWCWWYGGSFGARPLIDYYAVLSIPMAASVHWLLNQKRQFQHIAKVVIGLFIFLSVFQHNQYTRGVIHHDSMTEKSYWLVFLKNNHPEGFYKSLSAPDYQKALKGERGI